MRHSRPAATWPGYGRLFNGQVDPRDKGDPHETDYLFPFRPPPAANFVPTPRRAREITEGFLQAERTVGRRLPLILLKNGSLKPQQRLGGARGWKAMGAIR